MFAAMFTKARRLGEINPPRVAATAIVALAAFAAPARSEDPPAAPRPVREIRVRLACDEEFRRDRGDQWVWQARRCIEKASEIFERQFAIRWKVVDVVEWWSDDDAATPQILLEQFDRDVPRSGVDVAFGLTGQMRPKGGDCDYRNAGVARYFGTAGLALAPGSDFIELEARSVAHELGHMLGAWHCVERGSVMQYAWDRSADRFDAQSAAVIELCRDLDFARGVDWLDEARRRRMDEIFRAGHLPREVVPYVNVAMKRAWALVFEKGDVSAGRYLYRRALAEQEACAGPDDLGMLWCLVGLARAEMTGPARDLDEARTLAARALTFDISNESRGPDLPDAETLMADVEWESGHRDEALTHYAAASESLKRRRLPNDPERTAAWSTLFRRRREAFDLGGRPAWTEIAWRVVPPLLPPAPTATFEAPEPGNVHVRRSPLVSERDGKPFDPPSETMVVATAAPGELTIGLSEIGASGTWTAPNGVTARIPAATSTAPGAVVEVSYVVAPKRRTPEFVEYDVQLRIRPSGDGASPSVARSRIDAPGRASVCVDRSPIVGAAGFLRLPCGTSLIDCRQWVGASESPAIKFESDTVGTVDGARFTPDGAGAQRTWRLELTFTPDAPK